MGRRILFITTTNIASNPRLFKELLLADVTFKNIEVIQFSLGGWSDEHSEKLKEKFENIHFIELSAKRRPLFQWLIVTLFQWILSKFPSNWLNLKLLSYSLNKRTIILSRFVKKLKIKYDWVVAHNPGAFYPSFELAKSNGCKLGLDIEDFHPGECTELSESLKMLNMMKLILPNANYCSFAAPLIQLEVEKYISQKSNSWFTVINGFPQNEFNEPQVIDSKKLKLVWFSQNITFNRGLEKFISVMDEFNNDIELHLVGSISEQMRELMFSKNTSIVIHQPMSQINLHQFLSGFHVGLAVDPPMNRNRELAVTNKIVAYAQSGLFIVAISSAGQNAFLRQTDLQFLIINNEFHEIRSGLLFVLELFRNGKIDTESQFKYGSAHCWENLSPMILEAWNL